MTFRDDTAAVFEEFTKTIADTIRSFDGCLHLDIYRDINSPAIFFSYSHWESEEYLENYRMSDFFRKTWTQTKTWFGDKPSAWSVQKI